MKTNAIRILRHVARPALLLLAGAALLGSSARAASMDLWVYAKGQQMALLVPGSNTGGRLVYKSSLGCYITDRASRGEFVLVTISPSTAAEQANPVIGGRWLSSTAGTMVLQPLGMMAAFTVPTNPAWDNNYVVVQTVSGVFSTRVPLGGR